MKLPFCPHEEEVAENLREDRWPWGANPALLVHTRNCRACSDILLAAQTLQQARSAAVRSMQVGSPGYLWWRAQLRLRNRAIDRMAEPVVWAEKIALISVACVACASAIWQRALITDWFGWLTTLFQSQAFRLDALWLPAAGGGNLIGYTVLAALGAFACIGGLALFITAGKE